MNLCAVQDCTNKRRSREWCPKHYTRWVRHGDPLFTVYDMDMSPEDKFWSKVDKESSPDGCWLWTGALNDNGYGRFEAKGTNYAHIWAYEHFVGPIPEDLELDHVRKNGCVNRHCVNFERHLEPVTHAENDRRRRGETCGKGHAMVEGNLYFQSNGKRRCKTCNKAKARRQTGQRRIGKIDHGTRNVLVDSERSRFLT